MRKYIILAVIIFLLVALSILYGLYKPQLIEHEHRSKPVTVQVTKVVERPVEQTIQTVGTVYADQAVDISSQIDGQIEKIMFTQGGYVAQGASLIQLDDAIYRANLKSAEADLELSKLNYARSQRLAKEKALARQMLDQARADLQRKQAAVAIDQAKLEKTIITAPFSGMLGAKNVNVGQYVKVGELLVELVDIEHLKVIYHVPEKYLSQLKLGQRVVISSEHTPKNHLRGTVIFISPSIDLDTRSVEVQAKVDNQENSMTPGQFVKVVQVLGINERALMIPEESLMPSLEGQKVYQVVKGRAKSVSVKVGTRVKGNVEVLSGLQVGDTIVSAGQQKIKDGTFVKEVASP